MKNIPEINWESKPDKYNYPSAEEYLTLIIPEQAIKEIINDLKCSSIVSYKAKDIFRSSGLVLLGVENYHVQHDIKAITNREKISPLLLVRDVQLRKLIIADGYHRLCAVYAFDEDADIPCQISTYNFVNF